MNAVEFVKECGIDVARRTLGNAVGFGCSRVYLFGGKYIFRTDDLKQIVDAWELVESYGGVDMAKRFFDENIKCSDSDVLEKAINLVEQCNA